MEKIQDCGKYMIEVWRACGMDLTNVEFVWASEFISKLPFRKIERKAQGKPNTMPCCCWSSHSICQLLVS